MPPKDIAVGEKTYQCRVETTVGQAVSAIRDAYRLTGGYLADSEGAIIDLTTLIRDTTGELEFLEGQSAQQSNIIPPTTYLFHYTSPI